LPQLVPDSFRFAGRVLKKDKLRRRGSKELAKKDVTISAVAANNTIDDGNTTATPTAGGAALVSVFADKNVGIGTAVAVGGFTVSGPDAGNDSLTRPAASADITARVPTMVSK